MKKFSRNIVLTVTAVLASSYVLAGSVVAAPINPTNQAQTETVKDATGNIISAGQEVPINSDVENEAVGAGYTVTLENADVTNNAYLAGYTVKVDKATIGGTAALAGNDIDLNAPVGNNIFAAGNSIRIGAETVGNALYAVGAVLNISGQYEVVDINGEKVTFNGTSSGNVNINAGQVTIGEDAKIDGKLTITSATEPTLPDSVSVGDYEFIQAKSSDYNNAINVNENSSVGTKILNVVKSILYWVVASTILSFIFCALFHKPLDGAKEMVTKKPVAMLLSGFITLLALPAAFILACITFVGLPVAGLIAALVAPMMFFSTIFAASSFGRFVFNKIKPGFHPVAASLLGTIIVVVVKNIPILGAVIGFTCMIYTIGYFIQVAFGQMKTFQLKREVIADVQSNDM